MHRHSTPILCVGLLVAEGCYHLEVEQTLANPYGLLGRALLEQMELV